MSESSPAEPNEDGLLTLPTKRLIADIASVLERQLIDTYIVWGPHSPCSLLRGAGGFGSSLSADNRASVQVPLPKIIVNTDGSARTAAW